VPKVFVTDLGDGLRHPGSLNQKYNRYRRLKDLEEHLRYQHPNLASTLIETTPYLRAPSGSPYWIQFQEDVTQLLNQRMQNKDWFHVVRRLRNLGIGDTQSDKTLLEQAQNAFNLKLSRMMTDLPIGRAAHQRHQLAQNTQREGLATTYRLFDVKHDNLAYEVIRHPDGSPVLAPEGLPSVTGLKLMDVFGGARRHNEMLPDVWQLQSYWQQTGRTRWLTEGVAPHVDGRFWKETGVSPKQANFTQV
jgi:hypothetical protein